MTGVIGQLAGESCSWCESESPSVPWKLCEQTQPCPCCGSGYAIPCKAGIREKTNASGKEGSRKQTL